MKGARRAKIGKATTSSWVIVDEVTEPVKPMTPGAYEIAKLLEGEEAANRLRDNSRQAPANSTPRKARSAR